MNTFTKATTPALFIILFTYAATSKMMDAERFHRQLYLQPFSHSLADILVYGLPALEILTAILLAFPKTRLFGLIGSTAMMAAFTAYISLVLLHYWDKIPCSCGGILNNMSWTTHLIFNWAFLIAGITALVFYRNRPRTI